MEKILDTENTNCFEEYKLLKTEEISHFQRKETINMFGWTSIGALIGITFLNFQYHQRAVFFLLIAIPILCFVILVHWLANISRIIKLGTYLCSLEKHYKHVRNYYRWETFLETNRKVQHEHSEYIATLLLYLGICLASLLYGNAIVWRDIITNKECYYLYEYFLQSIWINNYKLFFIIWSTVLFAVIFVVSLVKCIKILSMDGKLHLKKIIMNDLSRQPSGRKARKKKRLG
jgi:hypothetical protein